MKTKRKISPLRISPFSYPKLGEDQKKGLHSKLGRFLDHNYVKTKKKVFTHILSFCVLIFSAQVTKGGGAMPQFCILFYANYTILATQREAWHHAPPKYAPVRCPLLIVTKPTKKTFYKLNPTFYTGYLTKPFYKIEG